MKDPDNKATSLAPEEPTSNELVPEADAKAAEMSGRLNEEIQQRREAETDLALANQILEAKHA